MLHEITGNAIDDNFRCAAMGAADDWFGAGHGFEIHQTETFGAAGERENFASGVAGVQLGVGNGAEKMHVAADT